MTAVYKQNIVLEGCDGAGKTTLAKVLEEQHEMFYRHVSNPVDYEDGKQQNLDFVNKMNKNTRLLYDRGLLGEAIYGPIFRGYTPDYIREFESRLEPHNWLVLVDCDVKTLNDRYDGEFIERKNIPQILKDYRKQFNLSKFPNKIIVNSSDSTPEEMALFIAHVIGEQ